MVLGVPILKHFRVVYHSNPIKHTRYVAFCKVTSFYLIWNVDNRLKEISNAKLSLCYWTGPLVCVYALCYTIWDLSELLSLPCMVLWIIIRCLCQIWLHFMQISSENWIRYKLNFILFWKFLSVYINLAQNQVRLALLYLRIMKFWPYNHIILNACKLKKQNKN